MENDKVKNLATLIERQAVDIKKLMRNLTESEEFRRVAEEKSETLKAIERALNSRAANSVEDQATLKRVSAGIATWDVEKALEDQIDRLQNAVDYADAEIELNKEHAEEIAVYETEHEKLLLALGIDQFEWDRISYKF